MTVTHLYRLRRYANLRHLRTPSAPTIAAALLGLAGLIHMLLTPEHFREQALYGVVFTTMALFQLWLAGALLVRPGPRVFRAGTWGSGLIVLVYVGTRLVPPPGAATPEAVEVVGVVATALELATVVLLTLALPELPSVHPRIRPLWWGIGGGLLAALLWPIATGLVQWTPADLGAPFFVWYDTWSAVTPALAGSPLPHLWLYAPWWTLLSTVVIVVLVGLNLWLSTRLVTRGQASCRQRRVSLLTLLPAALSGPLCCGAPLVALLGVPALLSLTLAPYATGISIALLMGHLAFLGKRSRTFSAGPLNPVPAGLEFGQCVTVPSEDRTATTRESIGESS